jgi:hypothetical protein
MGIVLNGRWDYFFVGKSISKRRALKNQMKYSEAMAKAAAKKVTASLLS